ncbi:MAG: hypothetical protein ACREEM_10515 [Blastocatellia bacterium]
MQRRDFLAGSVAALVSRDSKPRAVKVECVAGGGDMALGGSAIGARLIEPFGVAFDERGNFYICEHKGQRVTRVDRQGKITLFAGTGTPGNLNFNDPHGLVISRNQQMYIADTRNHRVIKIDLKTGAHAIIAGTGQAGFAGDGGPGAKATFNGIFAIDLNQAGDKLYLTDLQNRRIRLLDLKTGIVTTIAGNGQADVPENGADAASSPLVDPRATAVDSKGNVYILERRGNALRVADRQGKIRTLIGPAGSPHPPRSPRGPERELNGPKHLCVDRRDLVIIADAENHLIRRFNPKTGTTEVFAGTGEKGSHLEADDPLRTQLDRPHGVIVHPYNLAGALYISDSYNHRVLKMVGW